MTDRPPRKAVYIHSRPVPFPLAFFGAALVTDLVYWRSPDAMWETFSVWLIVAGLVSAALSVVAGAIGHLRHGRDPAMFRAWPRVLAIAVAFALAFVNVFVHSRDGYTAVVPSGLMLSGLVVIVLLFAPVMERRPSTVVVQEA